MPKYIQIYTTNHSPNFCVPITSTVGIVGAVGQVEIVREVIGNAIIFLGYKAGSVSIQQDIADCSSQHHGVEICTLKVEIGVSLATNTHLVIAYNACYIDRSVHL